jgi:hypothetical protein
MKNIVVAIFVLGSIACKAQPSVATRQMLWGTFFGEYKISDRFSTTLDAQYRYEYTDGDVFQWLIRPGFTWKLKSDYMLTAGIAYFSLYPNPNGHPPRGEIRPWQEVARKWQWNEKHTLWPRVRTEQRFIREYQGTELAEDYTYNSFRVRVRCDYTYLLGTPGEEKWFLTAGSETFFQWKPDGFSSFDQQRTWAGAGFKITPVLSAQVTYLNLIQQRNSPALDVFHVIRPGILYTLKRTEKKTS